MNGEVKQKSDYNPEDITAPRIVPMKKGDQGYGFNLHGEKGVKGQTISAVDKGSPAELGGLRQDDRVIEVNGTNVEEMTHSQVVGKIKEKQGETTLLVIDKITDKYLKDHGRSITADMADLKTVYEAPEPTPEPTQPSEPEPTPVEPTTEPAAVEPEDTPSEPQVDAAPPEVVTPEITSPAPVEPEPEAPQESSAKDAIDEINNVLEQEEQKPPIDQEAVEAEERRKAMMAAKLAAGKPKRKEVKGERMAWQDMKKQFEAL